MGQHAPCDRPAQQREPGEDEPEWQHAAPKSPPKEGNCRLDFHDSVIDGHFGKLIRAIDARAGPVNRSPS